MTRPSGETDSFFAKSYTEAEDRARRLREDRQRDFQQFLATKNKPRGAQHPNAQPAAPFWLQPSPCVPPYAQQPSLAPPQMVPPPQMGPQQMMFPPQQYAYPYYYYCYPPQQWGQPQMQQMQQQMGQIPQMAPQMVQMPQTPQMQSIQPQMAPQTPQPQLIPQLAYPQSQEVSPRPQRTQNRVMAQSQELQQPQQRAQDRVMAQSQEIQQPQQRAQDYGPMASSPADTRSAGREKQRLYLIDLDRQLQDKMRAKEVEKTREYDEDVAILRHNATCSPYGRGGGGAPLRAADGTVNTSRRPYAQRQSPIPPSPSPSSPPNYLVAKTADINGIAVTDTIELARKQAEQKSISEHLRAQMEDKERRRLSELAKKRETELRDAERLLREQQELSERLKRELVQKSEIITTKDVGPAFGRRRAPSMQKKSFETDRTPQNVTSLKNGFTANEDELRRKAEVEALKRKNKLRPVDPPPQKPSTPPPSVPCPPSPPVPALRKLNVNGSKEPSPKEKPRISSAPSAILQKLGAFKRDLEAEQKRVQHDLEERKKSTSLSNSLSSYSSYDTSILDESSKSLYQKS